MAPPSLLKIAPGTHGRTLLRYIPYLVGVALIIAYPQVYTKPFPQHLAIMVALYAVLGSALNILTGYAGQLSLGHAVFFATGAYTSSILLIRFGINPYLGMVAGMLVAVAVSFPIGYPTFSLRGRYFAIATLAINQIMFTLLTNWAYGGGAVGLFLPLIRGDTLISFQFHRTKLPYYFIVMGMLAVTLIVTRLIERSHFGIYMRAIKAEPDAASALGVNIRRYKMIALIVSAMLTAAAGTFYAQYILFIDPPSTVDVLLSVNILLVAVMGGIGYLWGPVLGALAFVPLFELTRVYLSGYGRAFDFIVFGMLILIITIYQPSGLMGLIEKLTRRLTRRWAVRESA